MSAFLRLLLGLSLSGSLLVLLLMLLRRIFGAKLPSAFYYGAWVLVLLRFLLPLPGLLPSLNAVPEPAAAPTTVPVFAEGALRPYQTGDYRIETPLTEMPIAYTPVQAAGVTAAPPLSEPDPRGLTFSELWQAVRAPRVLFTLWLLGLAVGAAWQLGGYVRFRCQLEKSLLPARDSDRALFDTMAARRRPRLSRSRAVSTPMLLGVLHPLIVLPEREYSETMLRGILAHELTHQRRGDVPVKWLAVLVSVLHWFNPVTRLFRSELDRACEMACDESLLRGMNAGEKRFYGDMLLSLAANRSLPRAVVATSFAVEKRNLKERLVQIMTYRKRGRAAIVLALAMMLLLSACGAAIGPQALRNTQTLAVSNAAPTGEAAAYEGSPYVTVSTVDELLAALAPNTTIVLEPGVYDLAAASDYGKSYNYGYYSWNDAYDGYELVIRGADNLTLSGLPGDTGGEIVLNAEPRYAEVLRFEDCRNLTLSALTLGHTQEPGFCAGGVVEFDACAEVSVQDCRLYGCGVLGVTAQNCDGVRVESSAIYECSSGAVWVSGSRDFRMLDCEVYDCPGRENMAGYTLFDVQTSTGFAVVNSRVHGNVGERLLRATSADEVYFLGTEISGNRFETLFESNLIAPVVEGCALSGNLYNEVFTGVAALRDRNGESLNAEAVESMALAPQSYEGPKQRETPAVTGIPVQDGMEYHVTTVDELLSCIGPDTTVYLDAETFRLSDAANYGGYGGEYYYWRDVYDGPGLVITGVQNFRLIGQGKGETTVLAEPRYADVLQFQGCENVTVAQLTAGHTTEPSYCMGDVLAFESCKDVHVVDCGLFGCGVWGIRASNCVQGDILRTEIYECSEGAINLYWTEGFVFTDCSVHDCAGYAWNDAQTKTAHNYLFTSDCGDIVYNGAPIPGGGTYVIGDGEAVVSAYAEYYNEPEVQIYNPRTTLHLFYYNIEVSQGFTLFVGDEVTLDAVPGAYLDGQDFVWSVDNAAKLGLTVSESGASCKLKALAPTQGSITLTVCYDDAALYVPVYIRD